MREQYFTWIRNPMTVVALFVGLTEITLGLVINDSQLPIELLTLVVWFTILFPSLTALGFFLILIRYQQRFFGPRDFRSDEAYLKAQFLSVTHKTTRSDQTHYNDELCKLQYMLIDNLSLGMRKYLAMIANKSLSDDELFEIAIRELKSIKDISSERYVLRHLTFGYIGATWDILNKFLFNLEFDGIKYFHRMPLDTQAYISENVYR